MWLIKFHLLIHKALLDMRRRLGCVTTRTSGPALLLLFFVARYPTFGVRIEVVELVVLQMLQGQPSRTLGTELIHKLSHHEGRIYSRCFQRDHPPQGSLCEWRPLQTFFFQRQFVNCLETKGTAGVLRQHQVLVLVAQMTLPFQARQRILWWWWAIGFSSQLRTFVLHC